MSESTIAVWDSAVFVAQTIEFNEAKQLAAQKQLEIRNSLEGARKAAYCEIEIDSMYSRHIESWGPGIHE